MQMAPDLELSEQFIYRNGSVNLASSANLPMGYTSSMSKVRISLEEFSHHEKASFRRFILSTRVTAMLLRLVLAVLLLPFVGLVIFFGATAMHMAPRKKGLRYSFFLNANDWMVVLWIGGLFQLSGVVLVILYTMFVTHFRNDERLRTVLSPDYSIIFFTLASCYMMSVVGCFVELTLREMEDKGHSMGEAGDSLSSAVCLFPLQNSAGDTASPRPLIEEHSAHEGLTVSSSRTLTLAARALMEELRRETSVRSHYLLGASTVLSALQVILFQACIADTCGGHRLLFLYHDFYEFPPYWLVVVHEAFFLSSMSAMMLFVLLLYFQHLREIEAFSYVGDRSVTVDLPPVAHSLRNLAEDHNAMVWARVWQQLVIDGKRRPLMKALLYPTSIVLAVVIVIASNTNDWLFQHLEGGMLTPITMKLVELAAAAAVVLLALFVITSKLVRAIHYHWQRIASIQREVQSQVDDFPRGARTLELQALQAKVRALQALDGYLTHAGATPKLSGLSLKSIRWTLIIFVLIKLNVSLLSFFFRNCHNVKGKHT